MITPSYSTTATERVLPRLALDFTTASLDARVTVTRSLNTATRTNASGILEIVNANLPRFDYDPSTLACKGLLIEETRTNLLLNSLIDGTILNTQIVTVTAVAYTISFYGTGTITLSGAHVAVVAGSGAYPSRKTYTFTPTAGALTVTVTGTVQFAQLEAGAFATSYIPTTATSLTRNADAVSMTGTNFSSWYNASEGAFKAIYSSFGISASTNPSILSVSDNTNSNQIRFTHLGTAANFGVIPAVGNSASISVGGAANNTTYKSAAAYKQNNVAWYRNATLIGTDTTVDIPTVNRMNIGMAAVAGFQYLNGHIQYIGYYPQRLTDAELQAFSK